ncbi:MAG TPA: hypothetical protein VGD10_05660 [Allosphingosinicella sp.]|uniref:hypothetical protein n=1 Tax=Allosphingosinicella sp. TaxID=2823234 RepID=UPI002ED82DB3
MKLVSGSIFAAIFLLAAPASADACMAGRSPEYAVTEFAHIVAIYEVTEVRRDAEGGEGNGWTAKARLSREVIGSAPKTVEINSPYWGSCHNVMPQPDAGEPWAIYWAGPPETSGAVEFPLGVMEQIDPRVRGFGLPQWRQQLAASITGGGSTWFLTLFLGSILLGLLTGALTIALFLRRRHGGFTNSTRPQGSGSHDVP